MKAELDWGTSMELGENAIALRQFTLIVNALLGIVPGFGTVVTAQL